jgi:hypothetical protein
MARRSAGPSPPSSVRLRAASTPATVPGASIHRAAVGVARALAIAGIASKLRDGDPRACPAACRAQRLGRGASDGAGTCRNHPRCGARRRGESSPTPVRSGARRSRDAATARPYRRSSQRPRPLKCDPRGDIRQQRDGAVVARERFGNAVDAAQHLTAPDPREADIATGCVPGHVHEPGVGGRCILPTTGLLVGAADQPPAFAAILRVQPAGPFE